MKIKKWLDDDFWAVRDKEFKYIIAIFYDKRLAKKFVDSLGVIANTYEIKKGIRYED